MMILFQKLFLILFIISTSIFQVEGQSRDGEDEEEDKGGIFDDKTKAKSGGGGDRCYYVGDDVSFSITLTVGSKEFPCDLYMGIQIGEGPIQYSPIYTELVDDGGPKPAYEIYFSSFNSTIPATGCNEDGFHSITFTIDLYCKDETGEFINIVPCETDIFDEFLPYNLSEECSVATEHTVEFVCCEGPPPPDPETTDTPSQRSIDCEDNKIIYIHTTDGREVLRKTLSKSESMDDLIQNLRMSTGLYFITTDYCGDIVTKKMIKH